MTEEQILQAKAEFEKGLRKWSKSQEDQTDGFEYEKSYVDFIRIVSQETLQISLGELSESKNKKKG